MLFYSQQINYLGGKKMIIRANEFNPEELNEKGIRELIENEKALLDTSKMNRFDIEEHKEQLKEYYKMLDIIKYRNN